MTNKFGKALGSILFLVLSEPDVDGRSNLQYRSATNEWKLGGRPTNVQLAYLDYIADLLTARALERREADRDTKDQLERITENPCQTCEGTGWTCVACGKDGQHCKCSAATQDAMDCQECQGTGEGD